MSDALIHYELAGADSELRFGPHCWETRRKEDRLLSAPLRYQEVTAVDHRGSQIAVVDL